jgi:LuxR family maltose regulon positive regulatory protein
MVEAKLITKLYIPPARPAPSTERRPRLVPRPRLIERLNAGARRKLTLISAPAGFGKTTLLSAWAQQCARPVAWISLDAGDNDPARFWAYVIAALQMVQADLGEAALLALQSPQPPPMEGLLTSLINEIAQVSDPFTLVLDDFHTIANPPIHDGLMFLLDHMPPSMHLILSSRADPPWPLARLRARRELTELRARDLRFTAEEASVFLDDVMDLNLSSEDVAALEARTEGWIAGLQMASLALQGHVHRSEFIQAFSGSHRFILDYLVEEVFSQQPHGIQEFLLKTSILERLTAPLCDALMGGSAQLTTGQAILTQMERGNLFLVLLDDERRWYRYHHLFADLLRSRLEQRYDADQVAALHRRASAWYAQHGFVAEAMAHTLAAHNLDQAADLIAENALAMIYQGQLTTVMGWLDALPEAMVHSRPWLCIAQAWALVYSGRLDAIEFALGDALVAMKENAEARRIKGHSAAIQAYAAFLKWDRLHGMEYAREALVHLPEEDFAVRGLAAMVLAIGLYGSGDLQRAQQAFAKAITASKAARDKSVTVNALCELADLQITQGRLHKAAATCQEALQISSDSPNGIAGYAYGRMSVVLREWNDLTQAVQYARRGVELSQAWGQVDTLILGYVFLASALAAAGDAHEALDAIREAKRIAGEVSPKYATFVEAKEARINLATGDVAGGVRWMQASDLSPIDEICRPIARYILLARVLLAQAEDPSAALRMTENEALLLLTKLLGMAESAGAYGYVIEILTLQALAFQAWGQGDQALAALDRAIQLAEPEGYVRTFIDEGEPMAHLLRQAVAQGIRADYAKTLLDALQNEVVRSEVSVTDRTALIEPLTERELEVLRLLVVGLPNKEIARTLFIAVGTVKQHLKHIYGKLDVHNRTEAADRARDLGLV